MPVIITEVVGYALRGARDSVQFNPITGRRPYASSESRPLSPYAKTELLDFYEFLLVKAGIQAFQRLTGFLHPQE